jgi:thymidylate synthase ThyX
MSFPGENFSDEEKRLLAPYFTNLDKPVFGLVNLPEAVKGALFARYSRYTGSLRRLFLEEFVSELPDPDEKTWDSDEGARAADIYERVFVGFGDDSIAQLGGAHIACEWCSNILTKIIQRPRIASYLEQSTRYIAYDKPLENGEYRYYQDERLGSHYKEAMDALFATYSSLLEKMIAHCNTQFPLEEGQSAAAHSRAIKAKALDLVRGLLPAATLSHTGVYASGQSYEQLVMHLLAHPLPEARLYGEMMLEELEKMIPSFVSRIRRPERGGAWIDFLSEREERAKSVASRLSLNNQSEGSSPSVELLSVRGGEDDVLAALLYEGSGKSEKEITSLIASLSLEEKRSLLEELIGERPNRRHRPGRGFEAVNYRFEIVSDYGAFRDLQRHRMLSAQWQALTPSLGAEVPQEVIEAGYGEEFQAALDISAKEYKRLVEAGYKSEAPYALCLAYRIRYILDMNAREAMQMIELRSGDQGHPSYRAVAQEMHSRISEVHPTIAASMSHTDLTMEPRLERLLSEMRTQRRLDEIS